MNNKIKLLSLTASILMIASVASVGSINSVDASHANPNSYSSGTIQFNCMRSLDYLDDASSSTCGEITNAAAIWTNSVTNVDFTKSSSNYEVTVKAGLPPGDKVARNENKVVGSDVVSSKVTLSLLKKFGDGDNWLHKLEKRFDLESVTLHEFGHSLGLGHDSNSPLMTPATSSATVFNTPSAHDIAALNGLYP